MSKLNGKKAEERVAGNGALAAEETSYAKLRRLVGMFLINDERTYSDGGKDIVQEIIKLTATLTPSQFKKLTENTRFQNGLRHTPLLLIIGALKSDKLRPVISELDARILNRPSDTMDLISLYQTHNAGRTIPNQIKKLIARSLNNFDEYQLGKYGKNTKLKVNLKDVINLTHPKPKDENQAKLFGQVLKGTIPSPMTWEVELTDSKDKKESWEKLMDCRKLPALATVRNLRNILLAGVEPKKLAKYIDDLKSQWIFPYQLITASLLVEEKEVKQALENYMLRMNESMTPLFGKTYVVLDISGSMGDFIMSETAKKAFSMAYSIILASEDTRVFLTAGSDGKSKHETKEIPRPSNINDFLNEIHQAGIGYGGIFTAQAINWIDEQNYNEEVERVVVISDSQDCDRNGTTANKIAKHMYVNNIAAYHNVGYNDRTKPFDVEITTFSSRIVDFIKFHEEKFNI